ncbi:MAG: hypothetical protein K2K22_07905 [Muribaculaceae bacterium]|nr:hypothetical protein [Muribaculaceae bacterium]
MTQTISIFAPEAPFLIPYIREQLPAALSGTPDHNCTLAIMISSCDIYGDGVRENCDETQPIDLSSRWAKAEDDFVGICRKLGTPCVILRCADIIGTGMTGFAHSLAADIWRGTFFHLPGNEARRSTIHASDIALIAKAIANSHFNKATPAVFNVSDGSDPLIHDIAEALAFRMNNKRISTLSTRPQQLIGRLLYGKKKVAAYTTTRTFSAARLCETLTFSLTPACQYMRTHIYNEDSL